MGFGIKDVVKLHADLDPTGMVGKAAGLNGIQMGDTSAPEALRQQALKDYMSGMPKELVAEKYKGAFTPEMLAQVSQQADTEMAAITTDPAFRQYQLDALASLEEQARDGLSAQDKADMAQLDGDVARQNAGRIGAIQQNMAARGMGGSGMELVAQLSSSQDLAQRQAQAASEKAAQIQNNKRNAAATLGSLGSNMQGQQFNQKAQQASAQDAINRFNTGNSVNREVTNNASVNAAGLYNNEQQQGLEARSAAAQNNFNQQKFDNQGKVSQLNYNTATNDINAKRQEYSDALDAKSKKENAVMNTAGSIAAAYVSKSDERAKKNISKLSDKDIDQFLDSIAAKKFKYKDEADGAGKRVGVLAQDIEKSKVGKDLVKEDSTGAKVLDVNNVIGALLTAVAHLNKKVK